MDNKLYLSIEQTCMDIPDHEYGRQTMYAHLIHSDAHSLLANAHMNEEHSKEICYGECKVCTHSPTFSSSLVIISPSHFPTVQVGDIIKIYLKKDLDSQVNSSLQASTYTNINPPNLSKTKKTDSHSDLHYITLQVCCELPDSEIVGWQTSQLQPLLRPFHRFWALQAL